MMPAVASALWPSVDFPEILYLLGNSLEQRFLTEANLDENTFHLSIFFHFSVTVM